MTAPSPRQAKKLTGRAALLATLTEAEWQRQVSEWATRAGWRIYHTADSRRSHAGFPDLVLVKPGFPVVFAELKTVTGRISPMQRVWIDELGQTSGQAVVCLWRPTDEAGVKAVLNATAAPTACAGCLNQ